MLVTTAEMLRDAQKGGYAVGHFNTSNMELTQAIIEAASELRSPVIVATSVKALEYLPISELGAMIRRMAEQAPVPVALHLDHGPSLEWVELCLAYGWSSIMIDASSKPYNENIAITRDAVEISRPQGIPVEAELGQLKGVEDWVTAENHVFTDPQAAKEFVARTGCSSLAVAIGTSHGAYKFSGTSKLDFERLKKIRELVDIPLVLHGASATPKELVDKANQYGAKLENVTGVSEEDIKTAISLGICKINTDTELRLAFTAALREFYGTHPTDIDPRAALACAREAVKKEVKHRIELFGSAGKA
jgi:fructose-bisphosphate aldolase, class II